MLSCLHLLGVFLCFASRCSSLAWPSSPAPAPAGTPNQFNVLEFGAWGNGTGDDSQAFLKAWRAACEIDNALVLVPRGRSFLVNPVLFAGPCGSNLTMKIDGMLLAPGISMSIRISSWITMRSLVNFTLGGAGIIDGQGEAWWSLSCRKNYSCEGRPTALTIRNSTNVVVQDLKLVNSPQMHLSIEESTNVVIKGLEIVAPQDSPNTDGIHTHMSKNIVVEKCIIGTGDDCISIGTNCSDVLVRGVICGPGHGISVGSLGRNKTTEFVTNLTVEDSILAGTMYGLRVKTWQGGQGFASNLRYSNVMMLNVSHPIIVDQYYCDARSSFKCKSEEVDAVKVSNISYTNIMGTSATSIALRFQCSQNRPCENLVLRNVFFHLENGSDTSSSCFNAFGQDRGMVVPTSCLKLNA